MRIFYFIVICHISVPLFARQLVLKEPVRFLALGDSYTIGQGVGESDRWPNILVDNLKEINIQVDELRIIARTGWRTDNLIAAIAQENPDSGYNLVSLLIGVNNQFQGVDIDIYPREFRQLLNQAIALCGGNPSGVMVLSIPDYGYTPFGESNQNEISMELSEYNQINKQVATELGVAYFNITPISQQALANPLYLATDRLHPSGEMYREWVYLVLANMELNRSVDLESDRADEIVVKPNPASEYLEIISPVLIQSVQLYDLVGNLIVMRNAVRSEFYTINTYRVPKGIYLLKIIDYDNTAQLKKINIHE